MSLFKGVNLNQEQKDIIDRVIMFSHEVDEMITMDGIEEDIAILGIMSLFVSKVEKLFDGDSDDIEAARGYIVGMMYELSNITDDDNTISIMPTGDIQDDQGGVMFG